MKKVIDYQITNKTGDGVNTAVMADIKLITEKSYICDLIDVDGKLLAENARFLFEDAIFDPLTVGEVGLVKKEKPTDKWLVDEIKTYLDSKQVTDEEGVIIDSPYSYTDKMLKADLLDLTVEEVLDVKN